MERLTVVLEESIMQKGRPATAGSGMLENFIAPVDAAVVTSLNKAGAEIAGRAKMDEFGISGLFNSAATITETVRLVADGTAEIALCNDYTGAVSTSAAERGLYYIRPTYGTVSRYGLIPSVPSMDQIGIICRDISKGFNALAIIAGYDPKDGVMLHDTPVKEKAREDREIVITSIKPEYSEIYSRVMQILCCAELANSISRYDGIKFGYRAKDYKNLDELYKKSRGEAFGPDVKLAALIGAMVLSQENYSRYYDKAMRLRKIIKDTMDFSKYDVIRVINHQLSRLCGLPSVTTPEFTYIANAGCEAVLQSAIEESSL